MSRYMVSIVVSTVKASGEQETYSTVHNYTFGDNERYLGTGAAAALVQSAMGVAEKLSEGGEPLEGTNLPRRQA